MKDKRILIIIACIILCILLIFGITKIIPQNSSSKKEIKFEDYLYSNGTNINKSFKESDKVYTAKGTFLGRNGEITLDTVYKANSFKTVLNKVYKEDEFDNEIQSFINDFKEFIQFKDGDISHSLIQTSPDPVDYEASVLSNVLDKKANLEYSIINNEKSYIINIYYKDGFYNLEIIYSYYDATNDQIPNGIQGK